MEQYIPKDALVAEIERRRDICKKVVWDLRTKENKDYYQGKAEAYNEVLAILDTMQEEPVSEELDAASIAYAEAFMKDVNRLEIQQAKWHERHPEEPVIQGGIKACFIFMRNAFKSGAEWQKKQDQETIELAEDHATLAGMENRIKERKDGGKR